MSFTIKCPVCSIVCKAPERPVSRFARCPRCHETIALPEEQACLAKPDKTPRLTVANVIIGTVVGTVVGIAAIIIVVGLVSKKPVLPEVCQQQPEPHVAEIPTNISREPSVQKAVRQSTKITRDNYNLIEDGMSFREVCGILGTEGFKSVLETGDLKVFTWQHQEGFRLAIITITFQAGQVGGKSMFD